MRTVSIIGVGRVAELGAGAGEKRIQIENLVARDPEKAARIAEVIEPRQMSCPKANFREFPRT